MCEWIASLGRQSKTSKQVAQLAVRFVRTLTFSFLLPILLPIKNKQCRLETSTVLIIQINFLEVLKWSHARTRGSCVIALEKLVLHSCNRRHTPT